MTNSLTWAITGVTGFIGSQLAKALLDAGHTVKGHARKADKVRALPPQLREIEASVFDITDASSHAPFVGGTDVVVHTAAQLGRGSYDSFYRVNVDATRALTAACVKHNVRRFIYLSSIEVYGNFLGRTLGEDTHIIPFGHPYGDSKIAAERAVLDCAADTEMEVMILRPAMVYGPESPFWTTRLADMTIGRTWVLFDKGEGWCYPIFIDDVVDAIMKAAECPCPSPQIFNITSLDTVTWREWAELWCRLMDVESSSITYRSSAYERFLASVGGYFFKDPPSFRHIEVMTRNGLIPNDKARRLLGWGPKVGLFEGMCRSVEWIKSLNSVSSE